MYYSTPYTYIYIYKYILVLIDGWCRYNMFGVVLRKNLNVALQERMMYNAAGTRCPIFVPQELRISPAGND